MTENNLLDKSDLLDQLDRHLDWIKNCDTKSSIVLAVIGIFLTLFTSDQAIDMLDLILSKTILNINFSNVLYLLLFIISWCIFIYGAYCLIRVLIPRLSKEVQEYDPSQKDSLYYFETIANNNFIEFKEKMEKRKEQDEITDVLSQIFVNAKICTIKYAYYSKGIKFSFLGIAGVLVLYVIGIILVKSGGF